MSETNVTMTTEEWNNLSDDEKITRALKQYSDDLEEYYHGND